jgi:hypothetical protein
MMLSSLFGKPINARALRPKGRVDMEQRILGLCEYESKEDRRNFSLNQSPPFNINPFLAAPELSITNYEPPPQLNITAEPESVRTSSPETMDAEGDSTDESDELENCVSLCDRLSSDNPESGFTHPFLSSAERAVVEHIMIDFWIIFNQDWAANAKQCTNETTSSSGPIADPAASAQTPSGSKGKRSREKDDDQPTDEDDQQNSKRPREDSSSLEGLINNARFACPYRKHDPRRYSCAGKWKLCALTGHVTVARVKFVSIIIQACIG